MVPLLTLLLGIVLGAAAAAIDRRLLAWRAGRIVVADLVQTCRACPSQWEGHTADGRVLYVRYRSGWLQVGLGETRDAAVRDDTIGMQIGDDADGYLTLAELIAVTTTRIDWSALR